MELIHGDYGSVSLKDLIEPAEYYAENGFIINGTLAYRIEAGGDMLSSYSALTDNNGNLLTEGATLVQPELAATLRTIQSEGAKAFYSGSIAQDIAAQTDLSLDDLASYHVNKRTALQGSFNGYTVYGAGVPLSGVVLIQMLEMAEKLNIADPKKDSQAYLSDLKKLTEAAYSDRYYTVTDPDFYEDGTDVSAYEQNLISEEYINYLLRDTSTDVQNYDKESPETTSFSVVDSNGLVVCATNTLSSFWGCQQMVDGFFLNNTNTNFSSNGVNRYEAGKRSRTFTAPTIITGPDDYVVALGTPGGNNIPSILFNTIVDVIRFKEDPQEEVTKSRIMYRDGYLTVEVDESGGTWLDLSQISEPVIWRDSGYWWGSVALAGYSDTEGAFAAYDYRRGATKAGVYNPDN